jgi:transposase
MTRASLTLEQKWRDMLPELNEKQRRHYAAREARAYGFGGVAAFSRATGMNRDTINQGIKELEAGDILQGDRIRRPGGGRKKLDHHQPGLTETIETAANPKTNHKVLVKWTSHSIAHIAAAVTKRGFTVGLETIRRILHEQGFALKANKKDLEGGKDHPDRDGKYQPYQHARSQGPTPRLSHSVHGCQENRKDREYEECRKGMDRSR